MAGEKGNQTWLIFVLIIVAAIFVVTSFTKEKPRAASTSTQDVLADKVKPVGIKPAHSEADQAAIAAVKPVSAIVMPPQVLAPRTSFAVQVYSFKDRARADSVFEKLKAKGYKAYVMESDLGARGVWYRVRVGSFSTEDEARAALERIVNDFQSGIIVTE